MRRPWYLRSSIVYSVVFFFMFSTFGTPLLSAQQQSPTAQVLSYEEAREKLAIHFRQLRKLRASLDETDFNPVAKAMAIGPDIQDLFRFARDEIAYEPYPGVLRYAEGTLMSRAGNAYDKSLLLGQLLGAHGYQVRYARAHLTEDQGDQVLAQVNRPPVILWHQPLGHDPDDPLIQGLKLLGATNEGLAAELKQANGQVDGFLGGISRDFDFDYALLTERLEQAGVAFPQPGQDVAGAFLPDARDHCWIQVKVNALWVDLDPSLSTLEVGQRLSDPDRVTEKPPQDQAYKVKIGIFIQQTKGGRPQPPQEVLNHSATLTKAVNHLSLAIVPEFAGGSISAQLADPEFVRNFGPVWPAFMINEETVSGHPFDLQGKKVAGDPQARQAEAVRRPVGSGLGSAGGALGGIFDEPTVSESSATPQLSRVWTTVTLIGTKGGEKHITRELVRRPPGVESDKKKAKVEIRRQILSSFEILATGSRISRSFVEARMLDYILANRPLFFAVLAESHGKPVPNWNAILDTKLRAFPFAILEFFHLRTTLLRFNAATYFPRLKAFAAEPQVVALRQGMKLAADGSPVVERSLDIMTNAIRTTDASVQETGKDRSADFRLQQGILDTLVEYRLLGGGAAVNAHSVIARAVKTGVPLTMVRDASPDTLSVFSIDASTKAHLAKDLERGYAVLAPLRPVVLDDGSAFAWWRVDPASGETLGMAGLGEGQGKVQWSTLQTISLGIVSLGFCGAVAAMGTAEGGNAGTSFLLCIGGLVLTIVFFTAATFTVAWGLRWALQRLGWKVLSGPSGGFIGGLGAALAGLVGFRAGTQAAPSGEAPRAGGSGRYTGASRSGRGTGETTETATAIERPVSAGEVPIRPTKEVLRPSEPLTEPPAEPTRGTRKPLEPSGPREMPEGKEGAQGTGPKEPSEAGTGEEPGPKPGEVTPTEETARAPEEATPEAREAARKEKAKRLLEKQKKQEKIKREREVQARQDRLKEEMESPEAKRNYEKLDPKDREWIEEDPTGRRKELAFDPDKKGWSRPEAEAGLRAEYEGSLDGPITRDIDPSTGMSRGGEFIDGNNVAWDHISTTNNKGEPRPLEQVVDEVLGKANPPRPGAEGENVLVDMTRLNPKEQKNLRVELNKRTKKRVDGQGKIEYVPKP